MALEEIFDRFNTIKALIIGDVMIDAYIWGTVDRISPEAPVPVIKVTKKDYRLGGAANVALNIQALGAEPILCAAIGNDSTGEKFKQRLSDRKISAEGIITTNRPTTVKTRILSSHQHVIRIDEEEDKELSQADQKLLTDRIDSLLPLCDVIIFEDYDKGVISEGVIKHTIDSAKKAGIPTIVDPKKRNFLKYHGATLFKPNLKELKEGLKLDFANQDQDSINAAVKSLIDNLDIGGALITLSERGVYIDMEERHLIPAHLREISDVSGAGDTVISIAALCLALSLNPFLIAALSNLGGGLVCEHLGVMPIEKKELLREALKQDWI